MKTLIIYKSIHHGNTLKIAKVMADVLEAELLDLKDVNIKIIEEYDLIGFGSGIYKARPHAELIKFIGDLSKMKSKKAFVFTTSGMGFSRYNDFLKNKLKEKYFKIIGEFSCKGFDSWGPFKYIGGIRKGKPDENDLRNAENFAIDLKKKV